MTQKLIAITPETHNVELYLAYATHDNFTGSPLYKAAEAYLHPEAEKLLRKAIDLAAQLDYRFKIFDVYRPLEIQQALWADTPNPEFLSNPETGSIPHCRGVAIDLTLIDNDGNELEMGTKFDAFVPESHHGNTDISAEAQRNRHILMGIMTTAGWDFYRNEWWHYQMFNPRYYPALTNKEAKTNLL